MKINSELQLKLLEDKKTFYEKRLKRANDAIESLNVKAPISGVVIYKTNWNNEKKQVGSDVFMLESVFSIPDLATLLVNAQVAEVDAGKVKPGQSVSVTLDAIPDKTFTGQVTHVSDIFTVASSERPVKVLQLRIRLDTLDLKRMRPGMAVRAEIIVDRFKDVLAVPAGRRRARKRKIVRGRPRSQGAGKTRGSTRQEQRSGGDRRIGARRWRKDRRTGRCRKRKPAKRRTRSGNEQACEEVETHLHTNVPPRRPCDADCTSGPISSGRYPAISSPRKTTRFRC